MVQQLYQLTLAQMYGNQVCNNIFTYESDDEVPSHAGARELVFALGYGDDTAGVFNGDTVPHFLQLLQAGGVIFTGVTCFNLYDLDDFFDFAFPAGIVGLASGDGMPPFNAYALSTARVTRAIRPSQKRFVGVSETYVNNLGFLSSAANTALAEVADAINAPVTVTIASVPYEFKVCTIQKEKVPIPDTDPVEYKYQYYEDPEEQLLHVARNIVFSGKIDVRSQVSRRYGQGI